MPDATIGIMNKTPGFSREMGLIRDSEYGSKAAGKARKKMREFPLALRRLAGHLGKNSKNLVEFFIRNPMMDVSRQNPSKSRNPANP